MRLSVSRRRSLAAAASLAFASACATDVERPPIARVTATPRAVPLHDAFTTDVVLDGTASDDPIDDPEHTLPLRFHWAITADEARFQAGDAASAMPTIRLAGERPALVHLTVTDADDLSSTTRFEMQVSVP